MSNTPHTLLAKTLLLGSSWTSLHSAIAQSTGTITSLAPQANGTFTFVESTHP
ncbi:MAG: hypothetical protein MUC48_04370 [Leptolyngbya sp. Prado105]|nr:hypothetical protein [Leptolyngbya sp. Prado105]